MAEQVYTTVRLDTDLTSSIPTNQYNVVRDNYRPMYEPLAETERSLTGKLHVHKIMDGANPMILKDHRYTLYVTNAELDQLKADLGKNCYFMPHRRDETNWTSYRQIVFFQGLSEIEVLDPTLAYFLVNIVLQDNSGGTVS